MSTELPAEASLTQLRTRAEDLCKAVAESRPDAIARVRAHHPEYRALAPGEFNPALFTLQDAQLTIAREHGMSGWDGLLEEVAAEVVDGVASSGTSGSNSTTRPGS